MEECARLAGGTLSLRAVRKAVTHSDRPGLDRVHKDRVLTSSPNDQIAGFCALAIMTKAPRAGEVKTRLIPPLTAEEAAALNICFLRDTASVISTAIRKGKAAGKNACGVAVYTPRGAEEAYADILRPHFVLIPQRGESFGERLLFAARS